MKKIVAIYHDPITKQQLEDFAVLEEKLSEDDLYKFWNVRFLDEKGKPEEEKIHIRKIYKGDFSSS